MTGDQVALMLKTIARVAALPDSGASNMKRLGRVKRRQVLAGSLEALALPGLFLLAAGDEKVRAPKRLVCAGTQTGWYKPAFFANSDDVRLIT